MPELGRAARGLYPFVGDLAHLVTGMRPRAATNLRRRPVLWPAAVLQRNLLIYGLGGLVAPFAGIKAIDLVISALGVK